MAQLGMAWNWEIREKERGRSWLMASGADYAGNQRDGEDLMSELGSRWRNSN